MSNMSAQDTTDMSGKRTVVVYSGPTSLEREDRGLLYLLNFEYFLENGIICDGNHDTVIVVTQEVAEHYREKVHKKQCAHNSASRVEMLTRENVCYDMESVRVALNSNQVINVTSYDYFVYVNCGMTGPKLPQPHSSFFWSFFWSRTNQQQQPPWTHRLTSTLNDQVQMTGLTLNCFEGNDYRSFRVQSFVFAWDMIGLETDCACLWCCL
jgi:hypothetical protein